MLFQFWCELDKYLLADTLYHKVQYSINNIMLYRLADGSRLRFESIISLRKGIEFFFPHWISENDQQYPVIQLLDNLSCSLFPFEGT